MARPLLHFLLIGAVLFALDRWWTGEAATPAAAPVVIPAERVEELTRAFAAQLGRAPDEAERAALIRAEVDDELLFRRALELGLHRDDPVVRNRLVQNMRFASPDAADDAEALYAEALELGMDRTDVVVHRRLVQRMRLGIEAGALDPEPDEAELRAWYEAHAADFVRAPRVRIVQIFFDREREEAARAALAELRAGADVEPVLQRGDAFLHPARQPLQSERELAGRFGAEFARRLFALPEDRWEGPLASAYGFHLVRVEERQESRQRSLDEVRGPVRSAVLAARRARRLAETLAAMREGVEVRVE